MARTGTYVAFDGQGTTNPTKSDIHYYDVGVKSIPTMNFDN